MNILDPEGLEQNKKRRAPLYVGPPYDSMNSVDYMVTIRT